MFGIGNDIPPDYQTPEINTESPRYSKNKKYPLPKIK